MVRKKKCFNYRITAETINLLHTNQTASSHTNIRRPPVQEHLNGRRLAPAGTAAHAHLSALVPEELASVLYDLFIGQQAVGLLLTQSEDLPQGDPERPHVTRSGELALERRTGVKEPKQGAIPGMT